ncbi:hypothetical protein NQZ68_007778 [Dissostichus eleginoides]|nr:hypothetical protein NQZ68_007778 [Dissostichus eleginoides]
MGPADHSLELTLLHVDGLHLYPGADRQTRAYAVESEGMRSLSADKCISDKRAAERLLSLRILTDIEPRRRFVSRHTFHTELQLSVTTTQHNILVSCSQSVDIDVKPRQDVSVEMCKGCL